MPVKMMSKGARRWELPQQHMPRWPGSTTSAPLCMPALGSMRGVTSWGTRWRQGGGTDGATTPVLAWVWLMAPRSDSSHTSLDGPMDGATLSTGLKCMVPFSALLRLVQFICNTSSSVHLKIASQGLASGLSGSHSYHNWRTKDTACLTTPQITQCSGHVTRYLQVMIAKVLLTSSDPDALEVLLYIVLVETI